MHEVLGWDYNKTECTYIYRHVNTIETEEARFLDSYLFITESNDVKLYLSTQTSLSFDAAKSGLHLCSLLFKDSYLSFFFFTVVIYSRPICVSE